MWPSSRPIDKSFAYNGRGHEQQRKPGEDRHMATFITSIKFTQQGIANFRDTCKRAEAFKATGKKMGVKVTGVFWTLGAFDGLLIFEAADEQTAAAALLQLGSLGNVQTQTARAFNSAEMEKILAMAK
jgi:uncharacterized protein with GYD domain